VGGAGPAQWGHPQRQRHGAPLLPAERPLRSCGYGKRWMVEPIGGSAYRYAPGKGWAVVVDRAA
jgi:hypothetical protein